MLNAREAQLVAEHLARPGATGATAAALRGEFLPADSLRLGTALGVLLQDPQMLSDEEALVALAAVHSLFAAAPVVEHPFAPLLLDVAEASAASVARRFFAISMLLAADDDRRRLLEREPAAILQGTAAADADQLPNLGELRAACAAAAPPMTTSALAEAAIPAMVRRGPTPGIVSELLAADDAYMEPVLLRPEPPLAEAGASEVFWLVPESRVHGLLWDESMCADDRRGAAAFALMGKAFSAPLPNKDKQQLAAALAADPKFVLVCGLTPSIFPSLVEHNPDIATDVLIQLAASGSTVRDYFSALVNMDLSLHSMEVVNRVMTVVEIPREVLHLYISNAFASCAAKDKYQQTRLVRLLCVFLQSLIRNNIIDVADLMVELQSFCIEHSRIKEAGELYRFITAQ